MTKMERGSKRTCVECGARFYDLNRMPIVCPSCGAEFTMDTAAPKRAKPVVEVEEAREEEPAAKTPAGVEIVSLDEAAAEETAGEELIDLGDDEDIAIEDDDEDVFLEDDEEEGDGVSGIVSSPSSKDDEDL